MTNEKYALPQLKFGEAVKLAWSKATRFNGRSRRSEFWWTYLAVFLVILIVGFIPIIGNIISVLFGLAIIPLTFRRLHDTGRSGWWWGAGCLLGLFVGSIFCYNLIIEGMAISPSDEQAFTQLLISFFTNPVVIISLLASLCYEILMLVFLCQDSQPEPNRYGDSPKYPSEE